MMRMWQGALGYAEKDGMVSPAYVVLRPKKEKTDGKFADFLFNTPRMIYLFWAYSHGLTSDRLRLYFYDFKRIPVSIPSLPEQKKIVAILTTWDNAINTTEQLLANSQQRKKALMQQLLTGKVRFKGFDGAWNSTTLGKHAKVIGGNAFESKNFSNVGIPILRISNIKKDFSICIDDSVCHEESNFFDKFKVINGDILIAMSGATTGKTGRYLEQNFCYLNQRVGKFSIDKNLTNSDYVFYLIQLPKIQKNIVNDAIGGAQPNISNKDIESLRVSIPPLSEQNKIATVLSTIDEEIDNLRAQLVRLRLEKKALMQQLLTGKVRVKIEEAA